MTKCEGHTPPLHDDRKEEARAAMPSTDHVNEPTFSHGKQKTKEETKCPNIDTCVSFRTYEREQHLKALGILRHGEGWQQEHDTC